MDNVTDLTPPTLVSATVRAETLTLTFNEDLDGTGSAPDRSAFTVTVDDSAVELAATGSVGVSGRTVTLTLAEAIVPNQEVAVSYTDPGPSNNPLQDAKGNRVANFGPRTAANSTPMGPHVSDTPPPTVNGNNLTIVFTEALDTESVPAADDFTVTVDGAGRDVTSVSVAGPTVTLGLAGTITAGQTVTVSYMPGETPLLGANGTPVESFGPETAANSTPTGPRVSDTPPPTVTGTNLTIVFTETLDTESVPAADDFTVTVDGDERDVTSVSVAGPTVKLGLAGTITAGQTVTVSYMLGETPLLGANGDAVESFGPQTTANNTPKAPSISDTPPPTVNGTILTIVFTEALDPKSVPAADDFTVTVDGARRDVTSVSVAGTTVTLGLAGTITARQTVTVSYTPGETPLLGANALAVAGFMDRQVTNITANAIPVFAPNAPTVLSVPENSVGGTPVGVVAAVDSDGDRLRYSLDTASAALFSIGSGGGIEVTAGAALDFEAKSSYSVTVSVSDGNATAAHELTIRVTNVEEPPDPPTRVTVRLATFNSLDVNWTAPDRTGALPVSDYDVRYFAGDADPPDPADWVEPGDPGGHDHMGEATRATIPGLEPDTPYRVQVRAVGDGPGRWSDSATIQTNVKPTVPFFDDGETVAFGIPENNGPEAEVGTVAASDDDGDTLEYTLTSASAEHRRFTIDAEGVIRLTAGVTLDHEEKAAYTLMAQVTDGKDADGNEEAVPEVDDTIEVRVAVENVEEPPEPPTDVSVSEATQTGLWVVWTAPADSGALPVSAYEVQYRFTGAGEWTDHPHQDTATSTEIGGLSVGTGYEVRVRAQGDGYSDWSSGEGRTLRAPPMVSGELPDLVLVIGAPHHEVDASGALSGQDVTWEAVSSATSIVSVIEPDGHIFKLRGETVGEARVTVTARNSSGSASVTMSVTVRIASEEESRALKNVFGGQARTLLGSATGVIGNRIAQWQGPALSAPAFTGAGVRPAAGSRKIRGGARKPLRPSRWGACRRRGPGRGRAGAGRICAWRVVERPTRLLPRCFVAGLRPDKRPPEVAPAADPRQRSRADARRRSLVDRLGRRRRADLQRRRRGRVCVRGELAHGLAGHRSQNRAERDVRVGAVVRRGPGRIRFRGPRRRRRRARDQSRGGLSVPQGRHARWRDRILVARRRGRRRGAEPPGGAADGRRGGPFHGPLRGGRAPQADGRPGHAAVPAGRPGRGDAPRRRRELARRTGIHGAAGASGAGAGRCG